MNKTQINPNRANKNKMYSQLCQIDETVLIRLLENGSQSVCEHQLKKRSLRVALLHRILSGSNDDHGIYMVLKAHVHRQDNQPAVMADALP